MSETILNRHGFIKFKLSADEVMAIFPTAYVAVQSALVLRSEVNQLLSSEHLGVGIGLHNGLLVEGLLGSAEMKFYDVIGDTVNTAKRIENAAQSGEILVSEHVCNAIGQAVGIGTKREIDVKGKAAHLVYPLENMSTG